MAFFTPFQRDNIVHGAPSRTSPGTDLMTITPSDSTVYDPPLRAISVNGGGNVAVLSFADHQAGLNTPVTMTMADNAMRPGYFSKILTTGTDASSIIGWR